MFKAGDKIRVKFVTNKNITLSLKHPTEDRYIKDGDILTVVGVLKWLDQLFILFSHDGNTINLGDYALFNLMFLNVAHCEPVDGSSEVAICKCASLLFGHDAGCPLNKGN